MKHSLVFIILAAAIGVAIGVVLQIDPNSVPVETTKSPVDETNIGGDNNHEKNTGNDQLARQVSDLQQQLQNEISARQKLEQKFKAINQQLADLNSKMETLGGREDPDQISINGDPHNSGADNNWFNEQALIASGMSVSQASELKSHFEQLELERLYLRDQFIRENWDRAKYREELKILADREGDLKNRLSETEYNAYLYATGQSNRVAVTSVLASAQAGLAGVIAGDYIIRYNDQRIYNGFDLREATAGGSIEDTVALEVERDGETMLFYLPRGPLGIRMNSVSIAP